MNKKSGLEFFSFDVDFFHDEKIQFISARFGLKGEIITIRLLCKIYRQGYYIDWNDDIALLFAKSVGDNCQHSCVKDVVYELLKRGFFDRSIFERFSILTSKGIQRRYFSAITRRKDVEYNPDFILINMSDYSNVVPLAQNVDILSENADILKQSKVKESKVKESKKKYGAAAPTPDIKHKRGSYGWVKLSDAELGRLISEYGHEAVNFYINYIDESAQQTGNKNKWKDWNLTIRKAIRNRWGNGFSNSNKVKASLGEELPDA